MKPRYGIARTGEKRGHSTFSSGVRSYAGFNYATDCACVSRRLLLPRDQSGQRPVRGVSCGWGLPGVYGSAEPGIPTYSHARAGVLSHAQSFSSRALALPRWAVESMDAVAVDGACPTISPVARLERPCLARPVQSVSNRARQSSPDGVALHRTKSGPGESRVTSRKLAVVECPCVEGIHARPSCGSWTRGTARVVARLGERVDGGAGGPTDPTERESQRTVWIGSLDGGDGGVIGAGCEPPTDRTPAETGGNVECPRFSHKQGARRERKTWQVRREPL